MPASLATTAQDRTTPTVLVVDDEVLVRLVIADYLRDCGYRVFEAGGPEEAVSVFEAGLKIDVVLTDLELPGRSSGLELARWIRKRHPDVKVILSSGLYSAAELARRALPSRPADRQALRQRRGRPAYPGADGELASGQVDRRQSPTIRQPRRAA